MLPSYIFRYGLFVFLIALASCKKQVVVEPDFAVLQMYGWIANHGVVVTNFNETPLVNYSEAARVSSAENGYYMHKYYISSPVQPLSLYAYPDTFPKSQPVLKMYLKLEQRQIYSLFLSGATTSLDTLLVKDNLPVISQADSASSIRFVNLMSGGPVSINLKGEPYGSVIQSLSYMTVSAYKDFPVKDNTESYEFEVRDAVTNELLATELYDNINGKLDGNHQWLGKIRTHAVVGIRGITSESSRDRMRMAFYLHN